MKVISLKFILINILLVALNQLTPQTQNNADDITGEWVTKRKDGHVVIYKQNGMYYGRLKLSIDEGALDTKNPDPKLRTRKIMGLVILNELVFDNENNWNRGTIYDPLEGKMYSCKIYLKTANELQVRGYIGISLFGRTDTWIRLGRSK